MSGTNPARVATSARLRLRHLDAGDEAFIIALLNEPGFLRYIGDRKVRTADDARRYIEDGVRASYRKHGYGLNAVERLDSGAPIGICGLLKRDELEAPDIGFAFLSGHEGQGYAYEAAVAALQHGRDVLGITRVIAIVSPDNARSIRLLHKLGLKQARLVRLNGHDKDAALFVPDGG